MNAVASALVVLVLPFVAQARDADPEFTVGEKLPPPPAKVTISLAEADEKTITLRITNDTGKPFVYSGYSPGSPIFQIKEHPVGWCGTGVGPQTLDPGRSVIFKVGRGMIRDPKTKEIHVTVGDATSEPIPME